VSRSGRTAPLVGELARAGRLGSARIVGPARWDGDVSPIRAEQRARKTPSGRRVARWCVRSPPSQRPATATGILGEGSGSNGMRPNGTSPPTCSTYRRDPVARALRLVVGRAPGSRASLEPRGVVPRRPARRAWEAGRRTPARLAWRRGEVLAQAEVNFDSREYLIAALYRPSRSADDRRTRAGRERCAPGVGARSSAHQRRWRAADPRRAPAKPRPGSGSRRQRLFPDERAGVRQGAGSAAGTGRAAPLQPSVRGRRQPTPFGNRGSAVERRAVQVPVSLPPR
jgi:hypothetical protein